MGVIDTPAKWKKYMKSHGLEEYPYLCQKELKYTIFRCQNNNDHEHCELCWDKFSEHQYDLHDGYTTSDENCWICEECFHDFKDLFHWTLSNTDMKKE